MPGWRQILAFWFSLSHSQWFKNGRSIDADVRRMFGGVLHKAERGLLRHWARHPRGFLALVIVLDQFSRHVYRGRLRAFSNDNKALALVLRYHQKYLPLLKTPEQQMFALLPLQHTKNLYAQRLGVRLLQSLVHNNPRSRTLREALKHQKGHLRVLKAFRRFPKRLPPHRRTAKEQAYVARTPGLPY